MNSASQLLRVLAIIGALAAGALFYLSNGKNNAGAAKQQMTETNSSAAALKDATDKAAALQADKDKLTTDLANEKANSDLADKARGDALQALDDANKKARDLQNASDDKDKQIDDLNKKVAAQDDLTKQITELTDKNAKLQAQVDAGPTTTTSGNGSVAANKNGKTGEVTATAAPIQLAPPAPAKILQIDTNQWLVVLDVGNDPNVKTDTQLQLKVGTEDVGTVIVRDNAGGMATAAVTSTGGMSEKDFSRILTRGLNIEFQRVIQ